MPDTAAKLERGRSRLAARWDALAVALTVLVVATLVAWPIAWQFVTASLPLADGLLEPSGYVLGRDFANLWSAARAALSGDFAALADATEHTRELSRLLGHDIARLYWSYPPTALWLGLPFSGTGFVPSLVIWLLAGLGAWGAVLLRGRADWLGLVAAAAILASPAGVMTLLYGQTTLFTTAVLIGGLAIAGDRPRAAGALLALMVIKPHLGLVIPVVLAARRQWPAFIATACFALAYLAATLVAFGLEPWRLFFMVTIPQQAALFDLATQDMRLIITPFMLLRALGLTHGAALLLHGLAAALAMVAVYAILRRDQTGPAGMVAVALATMLASPYVQIYELLLVATAAGIWILGTPVADTIVLRPTDATRCHLVRGAMRTPALAGGSIAPQTRDPGRDRSARGPVSAPHHFASAACCGAHGMTVGIKRWNRITSDTRLRLTVVAVTTLSPLAMAVAPDGRPFSLVTPLLGMALAAHYLLAPRAAPIAPSDHPEADPFRPAHEPNPRAV